jgi:hypothetical protein
MRKAMDIFARSWHYALVEFDVWRNALKKEKPIDLPIKKGYYCLLIKIV